MSVTRVFRALDHVFALEIDGAWSAPIDVFSVFAGIEEPGAPPDATYRLHLSPDDSECSLSDEDGLMGQGRPRVLLQLLIARLGQRALPEGSGGAVHGTTVARGDTAILLVGPSMRGKSTLAARLLLEGFALVAEDISAFDREDLSVRPYHRPIGLSERSFALLGIDIPPEAGEPCGCGGKVLAAAEHLGAALSPGRRPTVVALVDQSADTLTRLSPAAALARILELGVAPLGDRTTDIALLVDVIAGAHCIEVGSALLDQAADWLIQLAERHPPEPPLTLVEGHADRTDVYIGEEAVIVDGDRSHLLNRTAAAVWLLHTEGRDEAAIAAELGADRALVAETFAALQAARQG